MNNIGLLKKIIRDIFTGVDGKTYHMAKFSWLFSLGSYNVVIWYHIAQTGSIDFLAFAGGYGVICTTHSAAIWGMKSQEPKGDV